MSNVQITASERLRYTPMTENDALLMLELDQDPQVMQFINGGTPATMEDIEQIAIPRLNQYKNLEKGWGLWNVFRLEDDEYLGWILVRPMDFFGENRDDNDIELGWRFKRSSWGKGYATEAAKQIMKQIYQQQPQIEKFSALALLGNDGSVNIMKKLGMTFIKQAIYQESILGNPEVVYYSINAKDIPTD